MSRHPDLLARDTSALVIIDMQEPFLSVMHERSRLETNVVLLARAAVLLGVPVLLTTQNAARLGDVVPAVRDAAANDDAPTFDKLSFSCADSDAFVTALKATARTQIVLCGVETHICASQTAHDLLHAGFHTHVAADAVSSRSLEKHKLGMERIRDAGVKPCAAEAALYEWLRAAGTPEFKAILPLVR